MYLGPGIMYAINVSILVIMVVVTMMSVNARLTLFVLMPLPILSISIYYVNNIINRRSERIQEKLSDLTTDAHEAYSGIRVIKSYVQENQILKFFDSQSGQYKDEALKLARVEAFFFPLMMLLIGLSTIITIWLGGIGVIQGTITPGNIAEFVIYVNMLTWPITALGWIASLTQRAAASQKRINEFLQTEPEVRSHSEETWEMEGDIEFRHVGFKYPDTGIQALNDVSFTLQKGQKMAIIGRTGSGKTTIADLLVRTYDATGGEILIDNRPINDLNLYQLRQQMGYVTQDVFLFSDTVNNNIAFGENGIGQQAIENAAKNASIHEEIESLDQGYQSIVGERGVTLSGGQKQRISIARALIKDPKIIVLDDCLSAVDAKTEKVILDNLNRVLAGKTAIIITHRIFSLMDFDKIIVLEDGAIAEEGKHDALIDKKGIYYELYEKQKLEEKFLN